MSGPIESKISVALKAIERLMAVEPDSLLVIPDPEGKSEMNLIELEAGLAELNLVLNGLCLAKDKILEALDEWTDLNRRAGVAERPELETRFKAFKKDNSHEQAVNEAEERLSALRRNKIKMERSARICGLEVARQTEAAAILAAHPTGPPHSTPATPARSEISHEALKIGQFSGNEADSWLEWWELFTSIHDDLQLTDERKFLYLRSYIPKNSPAGELIAGFTPSEYRDAIQLLKQNFGKDERRARKLQQQLYDLPVCHSLEDVRKMHLNVERLCRQLSTLAKDTDAEFFCNSLEAKLTRSMLREILPEKEKAGAGWTTTMFRNALKKKLESELEISSILKQEGEEKPRPERKSKREDSQPSRNTPSPTIACALVGEAGKRANGKKKPLPPCYFCGGRHWANSCEQFATIKARTEKLSALGRCLRCCQVGHRAADCEKPANCLGCRGKHPLALCFKQQIPQQPWFRQKRMRGPANEARISAPMASASKSSKYCLLKCTEVGVFNPAKQKEAIIGTIFIDSGCQKSMITQRMVEALGLKTFGHEKCTLRGIGPANETKSYSEMVKIGLKTSKGPLEMELLVIPTEHLPPMVTVSIRDEEAAILDSSPLQLKQRIERPDVLIGAKYINELEIEKVRRLPSGFWLSHSALGPLLDSEGELANVAAFVTLLPPLNSTLIEEVATICKRKDPRRRLPSQPISNVPKARNCAPSAAAAVKKCCVGPIHGHSNPIPIFPLRPLAFHPHAISHPSPFSVPT